MISTPWPPRLFTKTSRTACLAQTPAAVLRWPSASYRYMCTGLLYHRPGYGRWTPPYQHAPQWWARVPLQHRQNIGCTTACESVPPNTNSPALKTIRFMPSVHGYTTHQSFLDLGSWVVDSATPSKLPEHIYGSRPPQDNILVARQRIPCTGQLLGKPLSASSAIPGR